MISVKQLREWLDTLKDDSSIGIDDGGLTLYEVQDEEPTEAYIEVGGLPEEEDGE